MKIKRKVTNSSSTSFLLDIKIFGRLKRMNDVEKFLKDNFDYEIYPRGSDWVAEISPMYVKGNLVKIWIEPMIPPAGAEISYVNIAIKSDTLFSECDIDELRQDVEKILRVFPEGSEFTYFQHPYDLSGDGWGGDAHGRYGMSDKCYERETKTARITVKKNKLEWTPLE